MILDVMVLDVIILNVMIHNVVLNEMIHNVVILNGILNGTLNTGTRAAQPTVILLVILISTIIDIDTNIANVTTIIIRIV